MDIRDTVLLNLRPEIITAIVNDSMSDEEIFQNKTIRPVVKLQNDILIQVFKHYIEKHKNVFYDLPIDKKLDYIENAIHKNMKFRNSIKGIIIGMFTTQEHNDYTKNSSSLNKRMMGIVKERLKSNVQLLAYEFSH
ncbi:MAG: hypothetical protein ACI9SJ_000256 [Flavobacteriaceae bacterium]|jgi:hypothetical protein|uniref:glyoxalase n=1 Tax=Candidatus Marifrigoribacter sp. Uisw_064 TaxID=3230970 RepID=UPI003AE4C00F